MPLLCHCMKHVVEVMQPVEHDLYADADQDEGRQADNDAATQRTEPELQFVGEAVAQENRYPNQQNSNPRGQRADDQLQVPLLMYVAAQREGHCDRSDRKSTRLNSSHLVIS